MNNSHSNYFDGIELTPNKANSSIIWLHGLGASGSDLLPLVKELNLPNSIRSIFPNAPVRSVTINAGLKMRAWYDIKNFDLTTYYDNHNHDGIIESQLIINNLIEREISNGVNPNKIILAGFSQGGALALHSGLRSNVKLAGIICLSGYLPWSNLIHKERSKVNQNIKIFMAHGMLDPLVPIILAQKSLDTLTNLHYDVIWKTYFMQHNIIEEEISCMENFLKTLL